MIDVLSVSIGIGVSFIIGMAIVGFILIGYRSARSPEYVVDMREVSNYYRHSNAARELRDDEK